MRRLPDVNVWIALSVPTHPHHGAARRWYEGAELEPGDLTFCRMTEMALLRLLTQPAVMRGCGVEPLTNIQAAVFLEQVYADPAVSRAEEPDGARDLWLQLAHSAQPAPLVWMDAYLAAFAISEDAELVTFDRAMLAYRQAGLQCLLLTPGTPS